MYFICIMSGADMACLERQGLGLGLSRDFSRTYLLSQSVDRSSAYWLRSTIPTWLALCRSWHIINLDPREPMKAEDTASRFLPQDDGLLDLSPWGIHIYTPPSSTFSLQALYPFHYTHTQVDPFGTYINLHSHNEDNFLHSSGNNCHSPSRERVRKHKLAGLLRI